MISHDLFAFCEKNCSYCPILFVLSLLIALQILIRITSIPYFVMNSFVLSFELPSVFCLFVTDCAEDFDWNHFNPPYHYEFICFATEYVSQFVCKSIVVNECFIKQYPTTCYCIHYHACNTKNHVFVQITENV